MGSQPMTNREIVRLRGTGGFCLTELMIASAAGAVVLAATVQTLVHLQHRFETQQTSMSRQQDLRIGLAILESEIRLAGTGASPTATPLLKAAPQEVEFRANLTGLRTDLAAPAIPGDTDLTVSSGSGWPKGKRVVLCIGDQCEEHRLISDGRTSQLSLATPIVHSYPAGSRAILSNQVRYYLRSEADGVRHLMRQVDGGASTLISGLSRFHMRYLDADGKSTSDASQIRLLALELSLESRVHGIKSLIGLAAR